jgi:hypothetical protein
MRVQFVSRIAFLGSAVVFGGIFCPGRLRAQAELHEIEGDAGSKYLGWTVATVGDVDADGVEDVLLGAPLHVDPVTHFVGRAFVYSGASGALVRAHDPLARQSGAFGWSATSVADLDGDGVADYVIGAPSASNGLGGVTAFSGATGSVLWDVLGGVAWEGFGYSVADLGDVDGDGLSELVIGRPSASDADVYTSAGTLLYTVHGAANSRFGLAVVGLQDLDGDGVREFAVGEPNFTDGSTTPPNDNAGRVRIYSGATGAILSHSVGDAASTYYGTTLARTGDLDADGFDDLLIGAPDAVEADGSSKGLVRVLSSKQNAEIRSHGGKHDGDQFGFAVAGIGDIDRDGVADYAITAPGAVPNGVVDLFSGADGAPRFELGRDSVGFGNSIAGGDFNGDGIGDWVVGNPWSVNSTPGGQGDAFLFAGCPPQAASYGAGWPGANGVPTLDCTELPTVDDSCEIRIGNSKSGPTVGLLFVGLSDANVVTSAGGTLLVAPLFSVPFTVNGANTTIAGDIPEDESLAFVDVYTQAIEADAGASRGLSFTPGLKLTIGMLNL